MILLNLVLLIGCVIENQNNAGKLTGQVVKDIEENVSKPYTTVVENEKKEAKEKREVKTAEAKNLKKSIDYYDLKQLGQDINELVGIPNNFSREPSHPDYVRSSHLKYYVIHTINGKEEHITNAQDFCKKYCGANWEGWQYYVNMSNYKWLFPPLNKNNFSNEYLYRDYILNTDYVNFTFLETSFDVEYGKVLEYQLISWRLDNSLKYFEGARDGTFLIYKIYCSPNMTIFLTPRWEVYKMYLPAATLSDSFSTWNYYIISIREEFLNMSNELLKRCPVEKEFFENYDFPDYSKSELLTDYWKVYYTKRFNLTNSLQASAENKSDGRFILKKVNVSFMNVDVYDFWNAETDEGVNLRIDVIADGNRETEYYKHRVAGILEPGQSINRSFSHKEIEFYNNVTVRAALYVEEKVESKPIELTLTKNELSKSLKIS